ERVTNRAVDLRRAAKTVGVLHAGIFFSGAVRFANLAALVKVSKIARGARSSSVGACVHDSRVESAGAAAKGIERERSGDVGGIDENVCVPKREAEKREHALGAVEK